MTAIPVPLDERLPQWGDSRFIDLRLDGTLRLADALSHLYVLLPVLDDAKHYWVSPDEVDKLIRAGAGWLAAHPDRGLITHRYLAHQRHLSAPALERLAASERPLAAKARLRRDREAYERVSVGRPARRVGRSLSVAETWRLCWPTTRLYCGIM